LRRFLAVPAEADDVRARFDACRDSDLGGGDGDGGGSVVSGVVVVVVL
jgi:hypothetical protein